LIDDRTGAYLRFMNRAEQKILLGIDTGGTYTDAVLLSQGEGILAKAKSLTTRHDLAIGIAGAVDAVFEQCRVARPDVSMVSMSTTLATNSLVEGKGGSVGLVMIGFDEGDMEKAGLREALGTDPVMFIPGGHDVHGNEQPLVLDDIAPFLEKHAGQVSGFAVAGLFAVRNPSHEEQVRTLLQESTGLPVTCSHELSSRLGGPKRALTTLLNARLIPVIHDLIVACRGYLGATGIEAPLMIVRGDGTLVQADFAGKRPIETILSGPAASLVGAQFLLETGDAIVSDIGGTTTDVAVLDKGWPRVEEDGAIVAGYRTMVQAVAMHTYGLGGDSAITVSDDGTTGLFLGPRREVPVSLLAQQFPDQVMTALKRQERLDYPTENCVRFAMLQPLKSAITGMLKPTEARLLERLAVEPQPLDTFLRGASDRNTLASLVSKGHAVLSGFTPSDAMHILNEQANWDGGAARLAAGIFCRKRNRYGDPVAVSADELARKVKDQLTIQSADLILETCMKDDGLAMGPGATTLLARTLDRKPGLVRLQLELDRPLVGLGASAPCYYPAIGERLNSKCIVPEHADVANAIGAVTSKVRIGKTRSVTSPDGGFRFHVGGPQKTLVMDDESSALECLTDLLIKEVGELAISAGAENPVFDVTNEIHAIDVDGNRHFVEARITVTATGRPKISN
jgi:N-methylhydantoinase A/oxoprolinase/acetone carboxylase beta subunit